MALTVLGELLVDGEPLSPRERAVLAALVMRAGRAISPDEIADAYWGDQPPATWPKQVQAAVGRLRRRLGSDSIVTGPGGYTLIADPEGIDAGRFERLSRAGHLHLATGEPDRAIVALEDALALWRGRPYADLASWPEALAEAARLDELRALCAEDLLQARLDRGEHDTVVGVAEKLMRAQPLRERRWVLLVTALYRAGRQADALAALRSARGRFQDELGIDPGRELDDLETAILRHDPDLESVARPDHPDEACPYPGLAAYDADDADAFFGRDAEITSTLARLTRSRFLAVAGPSGCGKSSIVRAGIVPALRRQGHKITVLTPGTGAGATLRAATSTGGAASGDVLVVDQFEEIFHSEIPEQEVADLCAAVAAHPGIVVLTVRSDFLDECAAQSALAPLLVEGVHLVTPMTHNQLRQAIVEPARRAGLRLEHGLVELVLRDAAGAPGVLPHVSHALVETWVRREGPVLTIDGYESSGGISGAIAQSADRLYQSLDRRQRDLCRSTLLRLVALSPDGSPVRQRMSVRPLRADVTRERLLGQLAAARLISTEGDSVVVAHEAVAMAWPRLRAWLEESADEVRRTGALSTAADHWEADGEPTDDLYRGARLEAALELRDSGTVDLTPLEHRFLDAAGQHEEARVAELTARAQAEARQNRRLRRYLAAVAVLLVLAVVAAGLLVRSTKEADRQRAVADVARESATVEAITARSLALRGTERDVAALLAAEAYVRWPDDPRTRSALLGTLTAAGGLVETTYLDRAQPAAGVHVPGTRTHLLTTADGAAMVVDDHGATLVSRDLGWSGAGAIPGSEVVAVSADGGTGLAAHGVATGSELSSEITVLDLPSLEPRGGLLRVDFGPGSLAVSPDGTLAAVGAYRDSALAVLDLADASGSRSDTPPRVRVRRLVADGERTEWAPYTLVTFTDDGRLVVAGEYARVRMLDPESLQITRTIRIPSGSGNISVTTTGDTLVASGSRQLTTARLSTGQVVWSRPFSVHHPAPCPWVAASTAAGAVFCGNFFGGLDRLDLRSGLPVASLDPQLGSVGSLAVSRDGTELTAVGNGVAAITRWRLDGSGPAHRLVASGSVIYEGYDRSGHTFLTARRPKGAREFDDLKRFALWDPEEDAATLGVPGRAEGVGWAGDNVLLGWSHAEGGVAFLDVTDGQWYRRDPGLDLQDHSWPSARGDVMYSADPDGKVFAVDPRVGRIPREPALDAGGSVRSLTESPDGRRIATTAWDEGWHVRVHDVGTGDVIVDGLDGPHLVAYAPTGELYAAQEGRITIHDPDDLHQIGTLAGAHGEINSMQFSQDGRTLLVTANDRTVSLYDVPTGLRLGDPLDTAAPLIVPGFLRPDGQALALNEENGVALWDLNPDHQLEAVCRIAGRQLTREERSTYLGRDAGPADACASILGPSQARPSGAAQATP